MFRYLLFSCLISVFLPFKRLILFSVITSYLRFVFYIVCLFIWHFSPHNEYIVRKGFIHCCIPSIFQSSLIYAIGTQCDAQSVNEWFVFLLNCVITVEFQFSVCLRFSVDFWSNSEALWGRDRSGDPWSCLFLGSRVWASYLKDVNYEDLLFCCPWTMPVPLLLELSLARPHVRLFFWAHRWVRHSSLTCVFFYPCRQNPDTSSLSHYFKGLLGRLFWGYISALCYLFYKLDWVSLTEL